jgi:hypothetical protein
MTDDPKAEETQVTETPAETMPVPEEKTTEEPVQTEETVELPEDAKERTREQFEKLKTSYREEREKRIQMERTFQEMQLKPTQQPAVEDWYNPDDNSVDIAKLRANEQRRDAELNQLRQQVQGVTAQTQQQEEKEVFGLFPELNPSGEKFDERRHKAVRGYLLAEQLEGRNPSFKEGAEAVLGFAKGEATKAAKEAETVGARKALEQLMPKEQAALEATGRSDRRPKGKDLDFLSRESRRSDTRGIDAIVERMKGIPQVGK